MQPLSEFLGQPAPPAAPAVDFPVPLRPKEQPTKFELIINLKMAKALPTYVMLTGKRGFVIP